MKTVKIFILLMVATLLVQAQQPLTLTDAIAKALENNYSIIIAKGNQQIAELNNNWGTAGRYPTDLCREVAAAAVEAFKRTAWNGHSPWSSRHQ